jgi:hypothetical protein
LRPFILGWGAETGFPVVIVVSIGVSIIFPKPENKMPTHGVDEDGRDCWAIMAMMFGWRGRVYWLVICRFGSQE